MVDFDFARLSGAAFLFDYRRHRAVHVRMVAAAARQSSTKTRSYPIRGLSLAAPICVLLQLALGAAARHKAIGSIYHMAGRPSQPA